MHQQKKKQKKPHHCYQQESHLDEFWMRIVPFKSEIWIPVTELVIITVMEAVSTLAFIERSEENLSLSLFILIQDSLFSFFFLDKI